MHPRSHLVSFIVIDFHPKRIQMFLLIGRLNLEFLFWMTIIYSELIWTVMCIIYKCYFVTPGPW